MLSADAVYASAIANATTVHDTALSDAETNYTSQITAANAGFDTAKAASVTAYESALAAYTGDLSTFDIDPFDFNVGSPVAEVSLPAESSLPIAPRPRPNFTGPSFNFDEDASFQSESAADDSALQAAKNSASAQRRTKDQEALDTFNEEVSSQNESSNTAREAISDEFASDLEEEPETNLNDVHNTYNEGVQAAETNYHASIQSASNAIDAANLAASQSVTSSYNSNQATYNSAVIAAASAFSAALNADPPPSAEDVKAARGAYAAAVFAAGNQRDSDNAVASHVYAIKTIEAYRTYSIAHVNANKTIANAIRSLVNTYEKALAQHAFEVSQIHSAANAKQSQSNTDLNRDTTKAIAAARKAYQKSLSENLHEESIAIETAIANHWVDTAETVRDAIQRWQLSAPSPWTAYQLDLAENRLSLAQTLKTSHLTYSLNLANAERTKSFAKANAEHARSIAWADDQHASASAKSTASQDLRNEQAGSDLAASKKLSDDRAKLDEDMGAAIYAHDIAAIESQRTYSITLADANLAYTQSMISARRIDKGVRPSAAASAGATFAIAQNNAYRTLVKDQTNQSATLAESMRTTWSTYSGAQQEAEFDRRLKIAHNTLTYKNATSDQSHTSIVSLAQTEADYQKAIHASTLAYVQAVAPTDKVYSDEYVLHSANATVEDAEDLKKFYRDEATAHQTVIDLWNSSQGTRWSQLHADQAAHDFQWAMDVGIAEVKYAKDMRTHETTKQNALSDVAKGLRLDTSDAVKIHDDAFAGQTVTFVTNIAGAKNDASEVEADVESLRTNDTVERERRYANEERAFTLSHANRSASAEKAYQMAMFSANISYSNAEIQASADLDGSIGDAWEDYYDDVISDTELQAAIDDAVGEYNAAMSTATDDYNDAGREATDEVREARQDLFANWVEHRSKNVWIAQAKDISSTEVERVESLGASQRDLARAILDAVKAFANSRKESLNDFVTKISGFDAPAETERTTAMNVYQYDSTFTAYAYDRSIFDANAEKKKDDIASRGNYEVAWFNDEVALRTALIGSGDPLAGPKKDVAKAKAAYVDRARVAQNNYESQLSNAGFGRLKSRQDAELVRIAQSNAADLGYVNSYTPAYATFTINTEKEANILAAAKTISEAEYDYAITVASADENDSIASASANRDEALKDANDNRATKIGRAHTNFFNSEADQPTWTNRVWTNITSANYGYNGHYGYGYSYGGWGGYYGYGYYGYGNYGYGGWNYSGYGYGGLGYGYGYGWGRHYGWGNIWGYGAGYIGQVDSESSDTLNDEIEQAQDEFEEDAKEANVEFITAKADAEITRITDVGNAKSSMVQAIGEADAALDRNVGAAEVTLLNASNTANLNYTRSTETANETAANARQTALETFVARTGSVAQTLVNTTFSYAYGFAQAQIDARIILAELDAATKLSNASTSGDDEDVLAALLAEARVRGFKKLRSGYISNQSSIARADALLSAQYTAADLMRSSNNARDETDFQVDQNKAKRIRKISSEEAFGDYQADLLPAENTRSQSAINLEADYRHAVVEAEKHQQIAEAQARKTRNLDLADDSVDEYGYPVESDADKNYRKEVADAELAMQIFLADALQTLQKDDATSKVAYTKATAGFEFDYDVQIATLDYDFADAIAGSKRKWAEDSSANERDYLKMKVNADNTRLRTLSHASATIRTSEASAEYEAYNYVNTFILTPFTAYLRGQVRVRRDIASDMEMAMMTYVDARTLAKSQYSDTVALAEYTLNLSVAGYANTRDLAVAAADRDASRDRATAVKTFYLDSAESASSNATDAAASQRTYTVGVATAEKQFVHDQVDEVETAIDDRSDAITNILETFNTNYEGIRTAWWLSEAGHQADLRIASATADKVWALTVLMAEKAFIVAENNARSSFSNTKSSSYVTSEKALARSDYNYYYDEIVASGSILSWLDNPWSVRDDMLSTRRVVSDKAKLSASLARTKAQLTAGGAFEAALNDAEKTYRDAEVDTVLTEKSNAVNASLVVVTTLANQHRTAGTAGSTPKLAIPTLTDRNDYYGYGYYGYGYYDNFRTPYNGTTPGSLNVANRVSLSMPIGQWIAITDHIIDRMDNWVRDRHDHAIDYEIDLIATIPGSTPLSITTGVSTAFERPIDLISTQVVANARELVLPVESPLTNKPTEGEESGSESLVSKVASIIADYLLPNWSKWSVKFAAELAGVLTSIPLSGTQTKSGQHEKWSQARVESNIQAISPEVGEWLRRRSPKILYVRTAGTDVKFVGVDKGSDGSALLIQIGDEVSNAKATQLILQRVGEMVTQFNVVVKATGGSLSPWGNNAIGAPDDPFALADHVIAERKRVTAEVQAELQKYADGAELAVAMTPAGNLYAFVDAAGNNNPVGAVVAAFPSYLTVSGKLYKVVKSHKIGTTTVHKLDEVAEGATAGFAQVKNSGLTNAPSNAAARLAQFVDSKERAIAEYLENLGFTVTKNLREGVQGAGRQGDAYVNGVLHEFKTAGRGATSNTIRNQVNQSKKGTGQAREIIVDARNSGLTQADAIRGTYQALGFSRGKIDGVTVIGDGYFFRSVPKAN